MKKGSKLSAEQKEKISQTLRGKPGWIVSKEGETRSDIAKRSNTGGHNKGIKHSEEHKRNISLGLTGRIVSEETKLKISIANKGKTLGRKLLPETKAKMSLAQKGHHRKGWKLSEQTRANISKGHIGTNTWMKGKKLSEEWKKNIRKAVQQKVKDGTHNFWKGGISKINRTERMNAMGTYEHKLWRKSVFERDDYTCQECKERGKKIEADHIKPYALYPELRLVVENGRTLCKECHMKTDTWGGNTPNIRQTDTILL